MSKYVYNQKFSFDSFISVRYFRIIEKANDEDNYVAEFINEKGTMVDSEYLIEETMLDLFKKIDKFPWE